jgi:hypothetical protein
MTDFYPPAANPSIGKNASAAKFANCHKDFGEFLLTKTSPIAALSLP